MAVLVQRTREELRASVGQLLDVMTVLTAATNGSTTTMLVDGLAIFGADDLNGKWLLFTSGQANIDGELVQITDSTVSANRVTLTFFPAASNAVNTNATAEMWGQSFTPTRINNLLNQAVDDATRHIFTPTTDISLHTGGTLRYDLAGTFDMIKEVWLRTSLDSEQLIDAGNVWDESVDADFTITQDDEDKLYGRVTTKFVVAGTISDGDLASEAITLVDLSGDTHIEFPIKVDIAVAANDLILRLSATANGADTDKFIAIPALNVGEETWVRVAMTEAASSFVPSETTAIISVALEYNANSKANIIWMGRIDSTRNDSYGWTLVPSHLWYVDKTNQDLVFKPVVGAALGYNLMKLIGGDNPAQLTADTDATEIPERYMVYYVASLAIGGYRTGEDREQSITRLSQADRWMAIASAAKRNFNPLVNARFTN